MIENAGNKRKKHANNIIARARVCECVILVRYYFILLILEGLLNKVGFINAGGNKLVLLLDFERFLDFKGICSF